MVKKKRKEHFPDPIWSHCVSYKLYTIDMYMYSIIQCHKLIPQKKSLNGKHNAKICTS